MKYTKDQLIKLRDNATGLLRKMEEREKNSYQKVALSFKNSQATIDEILGHIRNDKTYDKLAALLGGLKNDLGRSIVATQMDVKPILESLESLNRTLKNKKDYNDEGVIQTLNRLEKALGKMKFPKMDNKDVVKAIKASKTPKVKVEFPSSISVDNFPPTKTPTPVTNININPLRGLIHTTSATVSTTLTQLPTYGQLNNRRAVMIFNNESTTTVFIGGSDVTASNGLPVLAQTYSPTVDAGTRMILYGVTSSGTADVRVMEISNDAIGG